MLAEVSLAGMYRAVVAWIVMHGETGQKSQNDRIVMLSASL